MDSKESAENISNDPLKHLLSLDWDDSQDASAVVNDVSGENKPPKQQKKVRFSDTVEQNYLDSNDDDNDYDDFESDDEDSYGSDELNDNSVDETNSEKDVNDAEENETDVVVSQKDLNYDNHSILPTNNNLSNDLGTNENIHNVEPERLNLSPENQIQLEIIQNLRNESENQFAIEVCEVSEESHSKIETDSCHVNSSSKKKYKDDRKNLQKQSEKINELLKNTDLTFSTALEIKQAVWEAWSTVKKWEYITMKREEKKLKLKSGLTAESTLNKAAVIQPSQVSKKRIVQRKKKKPNLNLVSNQNQQLKKPKELSKAEKEEIEMAFQSWKKQKEEILKQNAIKRNNETVQKRTTSLMDEEIKRERAESAYIEWKMKKILINKKEKEKRAWHIQRENEANELKLRRDREAQEMFQSWLERKYFLKEDCHGFANDRPPWLPPGSS